MLQGVVVVVVSRLTALGTRVVLGGRSVRSADMLKGEGKKILRSVKLTFTTSKKKKTSKRRKGESSELLPLHTDTIGWEYILFSNLMKGDRQHVAVTTVSLGETGCSFSMWLSSSPR